jgi:hypothetical protein
MVLFQKMGGMLQEALAMPGPVLSQASPTPSQTIMDTTSSTPYSELFTDFLKKIVTVALQ